MIVIDFSEMNKMMRHADRVARDIQKAEDQPPEDQLPKWRIAAARRKKINITDLKETYAGALDDLEQLRSELAVMIDTLPDKDQQIIMALRYLKGYPPDIISAGIHISRRNVFYIMKQAKQKLKEMYPDRIVIDDQRS